MYAKLKQLIMFGVAGSLMANLAIAASDPVGWWYLDEGSGTTAADSSGNGLDGTITDAVWVSPGSLDRGSALQFNDGGYVDLGNPTSLDFGTTDWTVTAWYKTSMTGTGDGNKGTIFAKGGDTGGGIRYCLIMGEANAGRVALTTDDDVTKYQLNSPTTTNDDQWHFVVGMRAGTELRLYTDGQLDGTTTGVSSSYSLAGTSQHNAFIGAITDHGAGLYKTYIGLIDDVRVFDTALTEAEIAQVMTGFGPSSAIATNLKPADGTTDVIRDGVVLAWDPAEKAKTHNVYFGTSFDEIDTADLNSPTLVSLNQDPNTYALGRLDFGTTYFWRVDEVNGAPDYMISKGSVAEFTVEPLAIAVTQVVATASSSSEGSDPENTINGSGLNPITGFHSTDALTMWVSSLEANEPASILYEFEQIQQLHEIHVWNSNQPMENVLGFGIKDMIVSYSTDGVEWTRLGGEEGVVQLAQAPGTPSYAGQFVSMDNALAKYVKFTAISNWSAFFKQYSLSEVQFSAIPQVARTPKPDSGSVNIDPRNSILSWRPGRDAGQHDVFVSDDPNAMGSAHTVLENSLALSSLDLALDTTYYWQVNEVNEALVPSTWAGDVWSLTTVNSFVVDDFESYSNDSPNKPFQSWIDGFGYTTPEPGNPGNNTGSAVGHDTWTPSSPHFGATFMETDSVASGSTQSMPVYYDNSGADGKLTYSQVDYAVGGQDWTVNGVKTLSIAFRGTAGNTGSLYIKINNTKIAYDLSASDIAWSAWQVWTIDLTKVSASLKNVTKLSIGVDGAGASGVIYIDDIRLYAKPGELISPVEPNADGLLTNVAFDEGTGTVAYDASGNGHDVSLVGSSVWTPGKEGSAIQFGGGSHGLDDDAENYLNGLEALTISLWVKSVVINTDKGILIAMDPMGNDDSITMRYDAAGASFGGTNVVKCSVTGAAAVQQLESSSNVQTTEWQHLCMTWETGGLLHLFIDGVENTPSGRSNANNIGPVSTCEKLILGKGGKDNTDTTGWDGLIDEVVIYGRTLSTAEILWLSGRTAPIYNPL